MKSFPIFVMAIVTFTPTFASAAESSLVVSTAGSPFNSGLWNQGWWSDQWEQPRGGGITDNYLTGLNTDGATYRSFFTFDLTDVVNDVVSATFSVVVGTSKSSDAYEPIGLFEVSTTASRLNSKPGVTDPSIHADLADGVLYGATDVPSGVLPDSRIEIQLNLNAVAAINSHKGSLFSVGAALLDVNPELGPQFMFGYTGNRVQNGRVTPASLGKPAELRLHFIPEPSSALLMFVGAILMHLWSELRFGRRRQ